MGDDTRSAGFDQTDSLDASTPTSSILGQAPFKLDLRIAPRRAEDGAAPAGERLKPVDRGLIPQPHPVPPAPVIDIGRAGEQKTSVALAAPSASPLAPPAPPAGSGLPAPTAVEPAVVAPAEPTVASSGQSVPQPTITAPFAPRAVVPSAHQLTLAPIAPQVPSSPQKPIDFTALLGSSSGKPLRKARRNPLGLLFKLALLGGLVYGGIWAAQKYVLAPKWQKDVKVLAEAAADRRGLEWEDAVKVEPLAQDQYALQLASTMLGVPAEGVGALESEWRAMGLLEGELDLVALGRAATAEQPAFYDPASGKVFELAGMSAEVRSIALSRALTLALLDQLASWSERSSPDDYSRWIAERALFDGDAVAVQAESILATLASPAQVEEATRELGVLRLSAGASARLGSPFALAIAGSAADTTSPLFSTGMPSHERDELQARPLPSDASLFDAARGLSSAPVDLGVADDRSLGMMYWYYALAGRIGHEPAWTAATAWNGDSATVSRTLTSFCVSSTIATFDAAGQGILLDALDRWALAPAAAETTVAARGADRVDVRSCDPGVGADTIADPAIPDFGSAPVERGVLAAFERAGMSADEVATACVVQALRAGTTVPIDEPATVDRSLTQPAVDVTAIESVILMESCGTF